MKLTEYQLQKILELATIGYRLFLRKSKNTEESFEYYEKSCKFDYFFSTMLETILGFEYPAAAESIIGIDFNNPPTIEKIQNFFDTVKPSPPVKDFKKNLKKNLFDKEYTRNYDADGKHKFAKELIEEVLKEN